MADVSKFIRYNLVAFFTLIQWFDFIPTAENQVSNLYILPFDPTPQSIVVTITILIIFHQWQTIDWSRLPSRESLARELLYWRNILESYVGYGNRWNTFRALVESGIAGGVLASTSLRVNTTLPSRESLAHLVQSWIDILEPQVGYGNRWNTFEALVGHSTAGSMFASLQNSTATSG